MKLIINGQEKEIDDGANLWDILIHLKVNSDRPGVALAKNNDVILKSEWKDTKLKENDRIEIVQAVQGG